MVVRNSLQLRLKKQVRIPGERWKFIAGCDGKYEVSDHGRVRRVDSGLILSPGRSDRGYLNLALTVDGTGTREAVHRLVMETFVGLPPIGYEVNHKDHNPSNNHLSNLEYITTAQNSQHRYHDRWFTRDDIDNVVEMLQRNPRPSYIEIEYQTGVPLSYVQNIASRTPDKGVVKRKRVHSKTRAQRYFEEAEKARQINMQLEIAELLGRIDKVTKSVRTGNLQCAIGEQNMIVWRDDPQYNDIHKAITEMIRWWPCTENVLNLFVEYTRPEEKG